MKKTSLLLVIFILFAASASAVLKEKDLGHTIHVLRLELYNQWLKQKELMKQMQLQNETQHKQLRETMERANTVSLMLYSQGSNFTFDMAYACQEATLLYYELNKKGLPYTKIKNMLNSEITRYDSLITALEQIPPRIGDAKVQGGKEENKLEHEIVHMNHDKGSAMLDAQGIEDRKMCITYAEVLKQQLLNAMAQLEENNQDRKTMLERIRKMNLFAQKKYTELQQSIFINPGNNYFFTLSRLPMMWFRTKNDFKTKYKQLEEKKGNSEELTPYKSEWRGPIVMFASIFMLVYILLASILSNIILRWGIPKRYQTEAYMKKRPMLIITLAVFIFAIVVMFLRIFIKQNLMIMATGLMIQMAWLICAICISLLIRLDAKQIKQGAKIYNPFILISVIVICFRIILIPNTMVNLLFPPILLVFTIWQIITLRKCKSKVPTNDIVCCSISLGAMIASCVLAWIGYTLFAVQILIWWMFQLAAIATITCIYDLMEMYELRVLARKIRAQESYEHSMKEVLSLMKKGRYVSKTWIFDLINKAIVPVCGVFSIILSILMAAEIFDLRALCFKWFTHEIAIKNLFSASISKFCIVIALYFVFRYINYLVRSIWFGYRRKTTDGDFNATLARNIIAIVIWGIYIVVVFYMLNVPSKGIALVTTGLSTGLGFASKSLLENFFYGISLMSGRVRVGDYIECDEIIGKVESITYQSTQIITLDGSVVAILNSDLFSKNFKNLTRNHQYVLVKIPVGVAYGTDINKVRQMLTEGISQLCTKTDDDRELVDPKHGINVAFAGFGDSSVDLFVAVWVLVDQKLGFVAKANEVIYNVLNENNIEIPFPHQDIHIHKD